MKAQFEGLSPNLSPVSVENLSLSFHDFLFWFFTRDFKIFFGEIVQILNILLSSALEYCLKTVQL
jgi:hypothetical protein